MSGVKWKKVAGGWREVFNCSPDIAGVSKGMGMWYVVEGVLVKQPGHEATNCMYLCCNYGH
jgi:hypothetical protein